MPTISSSTLTPTRTAGVPIWGLTPVNEPHGNGGHWESMHFSPESQNDFIKQHLGPRCDRVSIQMQDS